MQRIAHGLGVTAIAVLSLAIGALVLSGCGSSGKVTTVVKTVPAEENPPGVTTVKPPPPPVAARYVVTLTGFKKGSRNGSGLAVIEMRPSTNQLCWTFTNLVHVEHPTLARIFRVVEGLDTSSEGIQLGHAYTPSGCMYEHPQIVSLLESKPNMFYVNIHDTEHPAGAVRGPLVAPGLPTP